MALTHRNHQIIRAHFEDNNTGLAVDATCGNGHDTEFLCRLGFDTVFGFDVQAKAILNTKQRLENENLDANLILAGHEKMDAYLYEHTATKKVDCVMFNFGYLPTADKNLTTQSDTSLQALKIAISLLSDSGLVSLMCYPGHTEGAVETQAIQTWLSQLDESLTVQTHLAASPKPTAPVLFTISHCAGHKKS